MCIRMLRKGKWKRQEMAYVWKSHTALDRKPGKSITFAGNYKRLHAEERAKKTKHVKLRRYNKLQRKKMACEIKRASHRGDKKRSSKEMKPAEDIKR